MCYRHSEMSFLWISLVFILHNRRNLITGRCPSVVNCMNGAASQSQSHYSWRSVGRSVGRSVSQSVSLGVEHPWDSWQDFGCSQDSCDFVCHGTSSLTRRLVCLVTCHSFCVGNIYELFYFTSFLRVLSFLYQFSCSYSSWSRDLSVV
jgi:hypothetical protein